MIEYRESCEGLEGAEMTGFFVGWRTVPPPSVLRRTLEGSDFVVTAWDGAKLVGFITAVSDGVMSCFIPLLEVLPEYQNHGLGSELVDRMLAQTRCFYMVDLLCDASLQGWYERRGFQKVGGMARRNFDALARLDGDPSRGSRALAPPPPVD